MISRLLPATIGFIWMISLDSGRREAQLWSSEDYVPNSELREEPSTVYYKQQMDVIVIYWQEESKLRPST
jgi:hypothetical protein